MSVCFIFLLPVHRWILLFPLGNHNVSHNDTIFVYLDYSDTKRVPDGWYSCAQFVLLISGPHGPTIYTVSHKYTKSIQT